VKSKLPTAKKSKNRSIFTSFCPKQSDNFSREIKVEFLDKNEDFEQCAVAMFKDCYFIFQHTASKTLS